MLKSYLPLPSAAITKFLTYQRCIGKDSRFKTSLCEKLRHFPCRSKRKSKKQYDFRHRGREFQEFQGHSCAIPDLPDEIHEKKTHFFPLLHFLRQIEEVLRSAALRIRSNQAWKRDVKSRLSLASTLLGFYGWKPHTKKSNSNFFDTYNVWKSWYCETFLLIYVSLHDVYLLSLVVFCEKSACFVGYHRAFTNSSDFHQTRQDCLGNFRFLWSHVSLGNMILFIFHNYLASPLQTPLLSPFDRLVRSVAPDTNENSRMALLHLVNLELKRLGQWYGKTW